MAFYAGIDGGGTQTTCLIGTEEKILGRGQAPGSKLARVGPGQARASFRLALEKACAAAHVRPNQLAQLCMGIAGASRSDVSSSLRTLMQDFVACPVTVLGDMVIAMEAAFHGGAGAIVVAGTGSIAFGRNERGETARAGGWGSQISDEGSGEWIGRKAVAAALRAHDAGQDTELLPALLTAWKLATRDDVARIANSYPPPEFSQLVPKVISASSQGDANAAAILTEAGLELAQLARVVIRRLWPGPQEVRICTTGGIFRHSEVVRNVFTNAVKAERPQAIVNDKQIEPAEGALALARKAAVTGGVLQP